MTGQQKKQVHNATTKPPRDVVEFFTRWSEFRPAVVAMSKMRSINSADREVLCCVVRLIDRISVRDLE